MRAITIASAILVVVPRVALADSALDEPRTVSRVGVIASQPTPTDITFERFRLPANGNIAAVAQSRTIYLNHKGVTLSPGDDDSRTNRSSIISSTSTVPAWNTSAATWAATVTCMKDMFARWDVTVTDVDPGSTPHIEAVFGGSPQNVGMQSGVGGVSPFTDDCGIIENSIVFTFTNVFPDDAQTVCEVMAQEIAHSYGLDHEMLASDPMTYLDYSGKRTFKDQTVSCGEYSNRACGIGGTACRPNQNSVQLLNQRLGLADLVPPTMGITSPQDGDVVPPGFAVQATATDNIAVTNATLSIDGVAAGMAPGAGPFMWTTDGALAEGSHAVTVEVTDGHNVQNQTIHITVMAGAPPGGGGGSGSGSGGGGGGGGGDVGNDLTGGCSAGHDLGLGLLVGAPFAFRRRRRRLVALS
ncbi:MAG TPA: Ig-like domain-containing protein [Kofleriaceae bacterium]|nr:Ig-like domain-containing protein [Kofleriaceae bacterium]